MPQPLLKRFAQQKAYVANEKFLVKAAAPSVYDTKSLYGSALACFVGALVERGKLDCALHLVVAEDAERARELYGDFTALLGEEKALYLPATCDGQSLGRKPDPSLTVQRTIALQGLMAVTEASTRPEAGSASGALVVVTFPEALEESLPASEVWQSHSLRLKVGDALDHSFIKELLYQGGFTQVDFVSAPGEYAVRGGLIDVFSYANNYPYRISFFGDEIDSLRLFDPNTQNSIRKCEELTLLPHLTSASGADSGAKTSGAETPEENTLIIPQVIEGKAYIWLTQAAHIVGAAAPDSVTARAFTEVHNLPAAFHTGAQPAFNKNFQLLVQDIRQQNAGEKKVWICSGQAVQLERLREIFDGMKVEAGLYEALHCDLSRGFVDQGAGFCLYTDHQIFDRHHSVALRKAVPKNERLTLNDLTEFKPGDYVVHIDHGVGTFGGFIRQSEGGKTQELIRINYANNDTLLVNIHCLHKISRYKSAEGEAPKIHRLGSKVWQHLKKTTKRKLKDMAQELIQLYAKRKAAEGFAFSPDTYLQRELETSFMFEDTPDQQTTLEEVKQDMEASAPMDRLVCGDVGFGKTEVAVRAAFKAVLDGKQVAVLVPTTILSLQHYKTFFDRLSPFTVRIQFLSRLKTAAEVKEILAQLRAGQIDIIIGTHRLLNKDVVFKDLGLLIIDEEQKFGVGAKEKLRQMKVNIDTLTLSATPIPRTLQFSLMGARDMSFLRTPPPNRQPVLTEVLSFQEEVIREAVNRELARGGQIFFIHNKVQDIESVADMVRRLCPQLRIAIGHGQMPPKELEKVVLDFIYGDYDMLLCTTIIENGIDIPNVNTILINQAQNFGLSDLHQMRGRVGRSDRQAYCYLLVPSLEILTPDARRRLQAIEAFQDLGSGLNIALQDLDIRGAGNLLGGEQSGFISDMGFEAYQSVLNEALTELRTELPLSSTTPGTWVADCNIETDLEVLIPSEYVSSPAEKMRLYRSLNGMQREDQLTAFFASLEDRFGPPPPPVVQLGFVVRLRHLGMQLGLERIVLKNGIMLAYFVSDPASNYYNSQVFTSLLGRIQSRPGKWSLKEQNQKLYLRGEKVESVECAYNLLNNFVIS